MSKEHKFAGKECNLLIVATCGSPRLCTEPLRAAIVSGGGRVLSVGEISDRCAEVDFEFPRTHVLDMYGLLISAGLQLSEDAHNELTALCQCTRYVPPGAQGASVRLSLTLYPTDGCEDFLANVPRELQPAA